MKKIILSTIIIFSLLTSCSKYDGVTLHFEFVKEYKTSIMVGGEIGNVERVFEVGEIYEGRFKNDRITIRIEEHNKRNEDCPNNWCYQELVEVPPQYMKLLNDN